MALQSFTYFRTGRLKDETTINICDFINCIGKVLGQTLKPAFLTATNNLFIHGITYPKIDTITVATYCVNPETLDIKWFKIQAVTGGFEYPYMTFNNTLFIYKKYLNVPKGYRAIYSIQ